VCGLGDAEFANNLLQTAGPRFAGPIAILRNWTFCVFYVMAELWGSVVVSLLFWGFGALHFSTLHCCACTYLNRCIPGLLAEGPTCVALLSVAASHP